MKYAALCCTAKDEDVFLKEWIAYHSILGFEHFFIYDNCSAIPVEELLKGFASSAEITVLRHEKEQTQNTSYSHCLQNFGKDFFWIGFIDVDEFIRLTIDDSIFSFLAEYEPYAGVGLTWRMFSSSGHVTRPEGLVISNFTHWLNDNPLIKSIIQPAKIKQYFGPHSFEPTYGEYCVNTSHFPIPFNTPFTIPSAEKACIHHYYYKSRQCFTEKIAKGNPCNIQRNIEEFDLQEKQIAKKDLSMIKYTLPVKKSLDENKISSYDDQESTCKELFALVEIELEKKEWSVAKRLLCKAICRANRKEIVHIWTLRAKIASALNKKKQVYYFLQQAMVYGANNLTYLELSKYFMAKGDLKEANYCLRILELCKGQLEPESE